MSKDQKDIKKETQEEPKEALALESNVYQRLQKVRSELAKLSLKKSGKNAHSNYSYYELGDFLPHVTRLCNESGIMAQFLLQDKKAVLHVHNIVKPEEMITFYIPIAEAKVPAAQPVQNLGAQITYLERYLYMISFEIAESDIVDQQKGDETPELDQIAVDKINGTKTIENLVAVCAELKKELGATFQKSLVKEYTRRRKEIESEMSKDIADDVDKGLKDEKK